MSNNNLNNSSAPLNNEPSGNGKRTPWKKILTILAYTWAGLCLLIVFAAFANASLPKLLVKATSMKLDPAYSGGRILYVLSSDTLDVKIHEPVFPALFGESKTGFIQIEFHPVKQTNTDTASVADTPATGTLSASNSSSDIVINLPAHITVPVDYNQDCTTDFILDIDTVTGESLLKVCPSKQMSLAVSTKVKDYWMARITLPNPRKGDACAPSACVGCPSNR